MGLRLRRSIKLGKFAKINIGKKGASLSAGVKGAHVTVGKNGVRKTVGIPGTGVSYTDYKRYNANNKKISTKQNKVVKEKYILPEGVSILETQVPLIITLLEFAGVGLVIIGLFFPILLLLGLAAIITDIILMFTSKDFKCSLNMQSAINTYKRGNFNNSVKYANKALKYKNCSSARILIENIDSMK